MHCSTHSLASTLLRHRARRCVLPVAYFSSSLHDLWSSTCSTTVSACSIPHRLRVIDPPSHPAWPPMSFAPSAPPQAQPLPTMPPHPIRDQPQGLPPAWPTHMYPLPTQPTSTYYPPTASPHLSTPPSTSDEEDDDDAAQPPKHTLLRPIFLHTLPPATPQTYAE